MAEPRDLVVIGASAGGLEPLKRLLSSLPRSLPASVLVVVHVPRSGESHLPHILTGAGELPAAFAEDNVPLRSGVVYIAPADRHMGLEDSRVRILGGPHENGQRPAIDVLFRSAAEAYGKRVVGIVLSGVLGDGAAGLGEIKRAGGVTLVQSPEDADFAGMPEAAITEGVADMVLPLAMMPRALLRLVRGNGRGNGPGNGDEPGGGAGADRHTRSTSAETGKDRGEFPPSQTAAAAGRAAAQVLSEQQPVEPPETVFACPTCGGVLWEVSDAGMLRYRCHVGHVFSPEAMVEENGRTVDQTLWTALRMVRERVVLVRRMAEYARQQGQSGLAERYVKQAMEGERTAEAMRALLFPG